MAHVRHYVKALVRESVRRPAAWLVEKACDKEYGIDDWRRLAHSSREIRVRWEGEGDKSTVERSDGIYIDHSGLPGRCANHAPKFEQAIFIDHFEVDSHGHNVVPQYGVIR